MYIYTEREREREFRCNCSTCVVSDAAVSGAGKIATQNIKIVTFDGAKRIERQRTDANRVVVDSVRLMAERTVSKRDPFFRTADFQYDNPWES